MNGIYVLLYWNPLQFVHERLFFADDQKIEIADLFYNN